MALVVILGMLVLSGVNPYDRTTWALEIFPVVIAIPLLLATYGRFPLTTLLYVCIFVHALVLMLGGAYTYARVPLGFQIAEIFDLHRNPYDKIDISFRDLSLRLLPARYSSAAGMCRGAGCLPSSLSASF